MYPIGVRARARTAFERLGKTDYSSWQQKPGWGGVVSHARVVHHCKYASTLATTHTGHRLNATQLRLCTRVTFHAGSSSPWPPDRAAFASCTRRSIINSESERAGRRRRPDKNYNTIFTFRMVVVFPFGIPEIKKSRLYRYTDASFRHAPSSFFPTRVSSVGHRYTGNFDRGGAPHLTGAYYDASHLVVDFHVSRTSRTRLSYAHPHSMGGTFGPYG